ncbi:cell division protein ZapE [Frankia sp. B2]|uniref:cell division protein ZapE n=1 Tax=Frankia sp. B2 TaxID=2541730 RepID=UPI00106C6F8B|nr:cell division protein ZapE [Frankia sp. B2]TFE34781.1 cell division protein ZapE [Frankia sp. B2]
MAQRLVDRRPIVPPGDLVAALVPPPRFDAVRFAGYLPDPAEPSQAAAVMALSAFADRLTASSGRSSRSDRSSRSRYAGHSGKGGLCGLLTRGTGVSGPFGSGPRRSGSAGPSGMRPGVYLDGGFGVGKTHLLASLWHAVPGPKAYGTFVELTSLVGALGFAATARALAGLRLVAIDEFELDDPGDTVLVSSLLTRLVEAGVHLAATSNTQPEDLGAGRFAAADFRREIQGLAASFDILRVDGEDYRHRGLPAAPPPCTDDEVGARAAAVEGATEDGFAALCEHLAGLHPSRYGALVAGVTLVCLHRVVPVEDQAVALRVVVLADRLYDRSIPVVASGVPFGELFGAELLAGPHRKKYQRAMSRLSALARDAAAGNDTAGRVAGMLPG